MFQFGLNTSLLVPQRVEMLTGGGLMPNYFHDACVLAPTSSFPFSILALSASGFFPVSGMYPLSI